MKHYFVKSRFRGWVEVSREKYMAYCSHIWYGSTAVPESKKAALIASKTAITEDI